jgi:hypothetical protein
MIDKKYYLTLVPSFPPRINTIKKYDYSFVRQDTVSYNRLA